MTDDDVCYFLIVNVGTIGIFTVFTERNVSMRKGCLWECICRVRRLKAKK